MFSIWDIFWIVFVLSLILWMIIVAVTEKSARKKNASKLAVNISSMENAGVPNATGPAVDDFGTPSTDEFDPNSFK